MAKPSFSKMEPISSLSVDDKKKKKVAFKEPTATNRPLNFPGEFSTNTPAIRGHAPDVTRAASQHLMNLSHNPEFLASLSQEDGELGEEQEVTVDNLPDVIHNEVAVNAKFNPTWHQVASLPGNVQKGIELLGKKIFKQFTDVPTKKIWQISSITNPVIEVKAIYAWIKDHAHFVDTIDIDFADSMPGYKADIELWSFAGVEFLLVKDFSGYFIYSWPANNTIAGAGTPNLKNAIESAMNMEGEGTLQEKLSTILENQYYNSLPMKKLKESYTQALDSEGVSLKVGDTVEHTGGEGQITGIEKSWGKIFVDLDNEGAWDHLASDVKKINNDVDITDILESKPLQETAEDDLYDYIEDVVDNLISGGWTGDADETTNVVLQHIAENPELMRDLVDQFPQRWSTATRDDFVKMIKRVLPKTEELENEIDITDMLEEGMSLTVPNRGDGIIVALTEKKYTVCLESGETITLER